MLFWTLNYKSLVQTFQFLLDCCAVWSCRNWPTFQRCLPPPSSGRDFMAQHPRRQSSSYSPPWEPEIFFLQLFIVTRIVKKFYDVRNTCPYRVNNAISLDVFPRYCAATGFLWWEIINTITNNKTEGLMCLSPEQHATESDRKYHLGFVTLMCVRMEA
jgi:hypothetical protein